MNTILVLSGPNLNLLGVREPDVYGTTTLDELVEVARAAARELGYEVEHVQTNHEGVLVDAIHKARGAMAAIVINPGSFSHYAHVLADAIATFDGPSVELHITNPHSREEWRHRSVVAPVVTGTIQGFGKHGYRLAIEAVCAALEE